MKPIFILFLPILLGFSSGCKAAKLETPTGFAELEDQDRYDYRATSAQGVVLGIRNEPNEPNAGVDFWVAAIDARLRRNGYVAHSTKLVNGTNGMLGKQIRYTREEELRLYAYWLTVFANGKRVFIVEAGGDEQYFKPAEKKIEQAVLSMKMD